ncbi:unnamed protein product [Paramecium octaurelia]|uniref:CBM20 domain-containing protein n=1 Tax=Paramecium octaurelia TaxID=43137 RepID=A0A8S1Y2U3_PAROT|nr:unnamed protein product [Paramecium octaurelia]
MNQIITSNFPSFIFDKQFKALQFSSPYQQISQIYDRFLHCPDNLRMMLKIIPQTDENQPNIQYDDKIQRIFFVDFINSSQQQDQIDFKFIIPLNQIYNNLFLMPLVSFNIEINLKYGQALYLANSQCDWVVDKMCRMTCAQDSFWQLSLEVNQNPFEYKYAIGDYFLQNQSNLQWERGPNRILNWNTEKCITLKNKWEQRKIFLFLQANSKTSVAILMSNSNSLQKRLKQNKDINNDSKLFCTSLYVDVNEIAQGIEIQYYLLMKKKYPCELISKPINLNLSDQFWFHSNELEFSILSL